MVIPKEENFRTEEPQQSSAEDALNLFNTPEHKQTQRKKSKPVKLRDSMDIVQPELNLQGSLTYATIQPGMLILGCIKYISDVYLDVELPGLCGALINIRDISNPPTLSTNILRKMFSVGEFVLVKILCVKVQEKTYPLIEGTTNPILIYSDYNFKYFKKGMLVWGAIESKDNNGYVINIGVNGCKAFLSSQNIDDDSHYLIGKPIWCVVHKRKLSSTNCSLQLRAKFEHINTSSINIDNLDTVIPGSRVELFVDKITLYGIQGTFSGRFTGYINNSYLSEKKNMLHDFHEEQLLTAHILYVEPITRITHLSLRNLKTNVRPNLHIGDVLTGEVLSKESSGLFFSLNNKYRGFVTKRRLINTVTRNSNINEELNEKYAIGSEHPCRILSYSNFWKSFICTTEPNIVQDPVFTAKDLPVGQSISVTIQSIVDEGIVATYKNIRGFITNQHISDAQYNYNIKRKYSVNQQVQARILSVVNNKLLFTMKPSLVDCDVNLTDYENVQIGESYFGVVEKVYRDRTLIQFYDNVTGWLYQNKDEITSSIFFIGQVVKVYIKKTGCEWLSLSLSKPKQSKILQIGSKVCGTVTLIDEDGISFRLENDSKSGYIPNNHISASLSLCNGFKNTINTGHRLTNLLYIGGTDPFIFSRKETVTLNGQIVMHHKKIRIGDIVRCYYYYPTSKGIYVLMLLRGMADPVLLSYKNNEEKSFFLSLKPYQTLLAQVTNKNHKKIQLELDKSQTINFESLVGYFTHYINDFSYLKDYGQKNDWKITEYDLGTEIDCKVEQICVEGGCILTLPNGAKGFAVPSLCHKEVKENDIVKGKVLSYDFDKQFVDICLNENILTNVNTKQTGNIDSSILCCVAEKLLVKSDCIVAVLKHSETNKQLIYVPLKSNENDFTGYSSYYNDTEFKVCIYGKIKDSLVGIRRKLLKKLEKYNRKTVD